MGTKSGKTGTGTKDGNSENGYTIGTGKSQRKWSGLPTSYMQSDSGWMRPEQ